LQLLMLLRLLRLWIHPELRLLDGRPRCRMMESGILWLKESGNVWLLLLVLHLLVL